MWKVRPRHPVSVRSLAAGVAALAGVSAYGVPSQAASLDFALERMVTDSSCRTADGQLVSGKTCTPDDTAFIQLINQYAMAVAPTVLGPANTTGFGGFEMSLEGSFTQVDASSQALARGTVGSAENQLNGKNTAVPSLLQLYSLRLRKGFGFGLEVGSTFGFTPNSSLISGGVDLKMAIFEGFREGLPGYIPDFAIGGSARTTTGSKQLQMSVLSAQAVLSKPITIASSGVLTPWVGYQYLWIFGDSSTIDFTPKTSAQELCGYQGPNQPGTTGSTAPYDGSPVCRSGGSAADFANSSSFAGVRLDRQRLFFGLRYDYEFLLVGAQLSLDLVDPAQAQNQAAETKALAGAPRQTSFALQVGASF